MPAIVIRCTCGKQYEVDPVHAGKVLGCAGCGRSIPIPGAAAPRGKPPAAPCARHPDRAATAGVCTTCRASLCGECLRAFGYYCSVACQAAGRKNAPALAPTISEADVARAERGIQAARKVVPALVALACVVALVTLVRWALREQGRELWRHDPGATVALMPPGIVGDFIACATGNGDLLVFEADGTLVATVALGEKTTYAPPVGVGGCVVVPLERGAAVLGDVDHRLKTTALGIDGHRLSQPLVHDGSRTVVVTRAGEVVDGYMRPMWRAAGPAYLISITDTATTTAHGFLSTDAAPDALALPVQAVGGKVAVATGHAGGAAVAEARDLAGGPATVVLPSEPGVSAGWTTSRGVLLQAMAGLVHVGTDGSAWRAPGAAYVGHAAEVVLARLPAEGSATNTDNPGPVLPWGAPTGPLVALDLATGRERWRHPLPHVRALVAADEQYLAVAEEPVFTGTDRPSAREAAQAMGEALSGRWVASPQPLLVLDAATGAIVRKIEAGGHAAFFDDGRLLVLTIELDPGLVGERQHLRTHLAMHALSSDHTRPLWSLDVPGALTSPVLAPGRLYALAGSQWPGPSLDEQPADGRYPPTMLVAIGWR